MKPAPSSYDEEDAKTPQLVDEANMGLLGPGLEVDEEDAPAPRRFLRTGHARLGWARLG